jgi:hypothetical protein
MSIVNLYRKDNQPFAQIPNAAIRDPQITPNAFRLLAYLMSHRDGYSLNYEQIERQTTLGRKAINSAADLLIELGWLRLERPKNNGQFGTKEWTILNPDEQSTVRHATVREVQVAQGTDIRTPTLKEHQELRTNVQTAFERFWEIYPRKQGKADALKAFTTIDIDPTTIINGALKYRDDPNRLAAFTKMPGTWLRAGCWDDEPLPERVLSREEKLAQMVAENQRIKSKDIEETQRLFAEFEAAESRAKADPPKKCVHDRIAVVCDICSKHR